MARAALLILVLCATCLCARAASKFNGPFLADTLVKAKVAPKAKAAEYYDYSDTEIACMQQQNIKECRILGYPVGAFSDYAFQTDLGCCAHDGYADGYQHQNVGGFAFSDKIGTCDWEVHWYYWFTGGSLFAPILTEDGTALKLGTAQGTCYLNANAERCAEPLCERMAISIQGGLYYTLAYSETAGNVTFGPLQGTCSGDDPNFGDFGDIGSLPIFPREGERQDPMAGFHNALHRAEAILLRSNGVRTQGASVPEPTTAKTADYYQQTSLYPGTALVISGPFYETSKHGNKIEETGMFELAFNFQVASTTPVTATNNWPIVHARTAKARFTREKQQGPYYQEGPDHL